MKKRFLEESEGEPTKDRLGRFIQETSFLSWGVALQETSFLSW